MTATPLTKAAIREQAVALGAELLEQLKEDYR
jgi:hypothetical protein